MAFFEKKISPPLETYVATPGYLPRTGTREGPKRLQFKLGSIPVVIGELYN